MNVLFITNELPVFPGSYGGAVRQFYLLKELTQRHKVTIVTVVHEHLLPLAEKLKEICELRYKVIPSPWVTNPPPDPVFYDHHITMTPFMVRVGHHNRQIIHPLIKQLLSEKSFDVIQVEHSEIADWLDGMKINIPVILDAHNIDTLLWLRNARWEKSPVKKLMYTLEAFKFLFYERKYWKRFTHIFSMSEQDRNKITTLLQIPQDKITAIPNGVDVDYFSPCPEPPDVSLVYTASMNHPPNVDGMLFFCRSIFPKILSKYPNLKLYIVGHSPTREIQALAKNPNIIVTGKVEDTRPYIARATVYIVPLRSGSGTRLKILEAMSMERAIVSTSIGAEGIEYTNGKDIIIADSPTRFADAVVDLLEDTQHRRLIGKTARQLVTMKYSWKAISQNAECLLEQVVHEYRQLPLRIGVNLLLLPGTGKIGGVETYIRNVLAAISNCDTQNHYYLFCHQENQEMLQFSNPNFHKIVINEKALLNRALGYLQFHFKLNVLPTALDRDVERANLDVMYYPYTIIFPPIRANIPIALTIPDIQQEYYPEFFSEKDIRARKAHYQSSAVRADRIIAVSEYTKFTLMEKYNIPSEKIDVVYEAYSNDFLRGISAEKLKQVKEKYSLPEKFLFYPSATWPHKNHECLLQALALIRDQSGVCPHLVLTGIAMQNHEKVKETIHSLKLNDSVKVLGYLPYEEIPAIFRLATVLVFPSLFEGFGIPIIEAMAVGLPITCTNKTSIPEIADAAALYFDPFNIEEMANCIVTLWNDPTLQESLRQKGFKRLECFTMEKVARGTLEVLKRTACQPRGIYFEQFLPSRITNDSISSLPVGSCEGFYNDGWVAKVAWISLNTRNANTVFVKGYCDPAWPHVPFKLLCSIDGTASREKIIKGGEFCIDVPLTTDNALKPIRNVRLSSDRSFLPSEHGIPDRRKLSFLLYEISSGNIDTPK